MKIDRHKKPRPPLDPAALERLAIFYVGRYATTRAKLRSYLERKLKERGWSAGSPPALDVVIERLAALGYVDDAGFAAARAAALQRRGYGERRIGQALQAAGIAEADAEQVREDARAGAWAAALRFAERRRIGPFAAAEADRDARGKAFAAMMRAGHSPDLARRLLATAPGDIPVLDND